MELSLDELRRVALHMGFTLMREESVEAQYVGELIGYGVLLKQRKGLKAKLRTMFLGEGGNCSTLVDMVCSACANCKK